MREHGVLTWLISDHLGSTSISANADGTLLSTVKYSAFGEIRAASGNTSSDSLYTGQRIEAEIGLYYYGARWYDPALGRFVQADTIVPQPANPMAWDRYAYGLNNPVRYVDPSGNMVTEGIDGGVNIEVFKSWLSDKYNWNLKGNNWKIDQAICVLKEAIGIKTEVDRITYGNGNEWMKKNIPSVDFYLDDFPHKGMTLLNKGQETSFVSPVSTIHLMDNFEKINIDEHHVAHEVFHTIDNRSSTRIFPATILGGGYSDRLATYVGGNPNGIRFMNGTSGIPIDMQWSIDVNDGYGNHSTADYLAEAFVWTFFNPSYCPDQAIVNWVIGRVLITTP